MYKALANAPCQLYHWLGKGTCDWREVGGSELFVTREALSGGRQLAVGTGRQEQQVHILEEKWRKGEKCGKMMTPALPGTSAHCCLCCHELEQCMLQAAGNPGILSANPQHQAAGRLPALAKRKKKVLVLPQALL